MANREISALPVADALGTDDLFLVQQSGAAKQVTTQQMRQEFGGGGGGGGGGSAGAYQFSIVDGDLICTYEGLTPPNYEVNDDGDLILTVAEGQTINCGRVQGRNGKAGTTPTIGANGNWFIGATDTGVRAKAADDAVLYGSEQVLTAEQQARARSNIGAANATEIYTKAETSAAINNAVAAIEAGDIDAYTKSETDAAIEAAVSEALGSAAAALAAMDDVIGGDDT